MNAVGINYVELAQLLLEAGCIKELQDEDGETALMHAARSDRKQIMQMLLKGRADPDIQSHAATGSQLSCSQLPVAIWKAGSRKE